MHPPATIKRITKDLKALIKEPVPDAGASPMSESDIAVWNGAIRVPLGDRSTVVLHFLISFPAEYPASAPSVGFSTRFPYHNGAVSTVSHGPLKGKMEICLDLLGNYDHVHTEWKASEGSGWSPAYTITTLLVNLQSALAFLADVEPTEQHILVVEANKFAAENPDLIPPIHTESEARAKRARLTLIEEFLPHCATDRLLAERLVAFVEAVPAENHERFLAIVTEVAAVNRGAAGLDAAASDQTLGKSPTIDDQIVCYATGATYMEETLGYGIAIERRGKQVLLSTPAELLSLSAFKGGTRVSTTKSQFKYFIPAFINPDHASNNTAWVAELWKSIESIGKAQYNTRTRAGAGLAVFPVLINTMLVEIMNPEAPKSAAIAYFEALCSFWRTFVWMQQVEPTVAEAAATAVKDFTASEAGRLKTTCPNAGALIATYTGCATSPVPFSVFIAAYIDESFIRSVMHWKRKGIAAKPGPVFEATEVSRSIAAFQVLMLQELVGNDVTGTIAAMDSSNGKVPTRLESLQKKMARSQILHDFLGRIF